MSFPFPLNDDDLELLDNNNSNIFIKNSIPYFYTQVNQNEDPTHMRLDKNAKLKTLQFYKFIDDKLDDYLYFCGTLNEKNYSVYNELNIEPYVQDKAALYLDELNIINKNNTLINLPIEVLINTPINLPLDLSMDVLINTSINIPIDVPIKRQLEDPINIPIYDSISKPIDNSIDKIEHVIIAPAKLNTDNINTLYGIDNNYNILTCLNDIYNLKDMNELSNKLKKVIKYSSNKNKYYIFMGTYDVEVQLEWFLPFRVNNIPLMSIITKNLNHFIDHTSSNVKTLNMNSNNIDKFENIIDYYSNDCKYDKYDKCFNLRMLYEKLNSDHKTELINVVGKFSTPGTFTTKMRKYLKDNTTKYETRYNDKNKPIMASGKTKFPIIFMK